MRKLILAACVVAALTLGFMPEAPAIEYRGEKAVLEHGCGGWGWGGGRRGGHWGGGRGGRMGGGYGYGGGYGCGGY